MATIPGTAGNDSLDGTADADLITGDAGNDTLNGEAGADTVDGGVGAGNAEELGAAGATVLVAGSAVFGADDPDAMVAELRRMADASR